MKRTWMIGAALVIAGVAAAGTLYGPDLVDGMRYQKAMTAIGEADKANGGAWPQPQETCFFCHGVHGQSQNTWYPSLSGQPATYIAAQLRAFATDQRRNAYMGPLSRELDDAKIAALAAYFARQAPARNEAVPADAVLDKRGMALVEARSCRACHGAALTGKDPAPRLAGQGQLYLEAQLAAFRSGERHDPTGAMNALAATLSGDDTRAVAHYLAGLSPHGAAK
ncbi:MULTISPECIES: c-type cytochrome [Burkholderia cepacia complex]|uniref:Cytochrome c, class I n=1 Tax=Burkholderia orbicola (strain MC0-3) TaxID=406425 RepID=B1K8W4_BURO0|nr:MULTISPECIES: c-type cytochrome [Burkholderia cepacia complex]ACA93500.1 cytochrome c, class I [Burkholderia orbicola MC0-3]MBR8155355.1 c-type cytochrome [Burkholderia cenocepacia]MCA8087598.1 c-type cytochrome [Burkholderia cenocepacia]